MPHLTGQPWRYVQCTDCRQAFHQYILTPEWSEVRFSRWMTHEAIAQFEANSKTLCSTFEAAREHTRHVLRIASLITTAGTEPIRLLDFGCGYGSFVAMCNLFGFEAIGVDRSAPKRQHSHVPILADLKDVNQYQDVVTLFEVLEHLDNPLSMLHTLGKHMKPDGLLVLETPDCTGVVDIASHDDYKRIHPLEHINGFTPASMRHLAARAGFSPIARPNCHVTTSRAQVLRKELGHLAKRVTGSTTQQYFRKT